MACSDAIALIIDDRDAPDGTCVHRVVWNISPGTEEIPEYSVPRRAIQMVTYTA